jgi:DNA mismatch endonuclease, patch repair protein
MRSNKGRDTGPELALRSAVHALGLRYRVNARPLKGVRRTADLVFSRARVAVFLDGCFWHGCPEHGRAPRVNSAYWGPKLAHNVARDRDTDRQLAGLGWEVVRAWEHEDPVAVADRVEATYRARRRPAAGRPAAPPP